MSWLDDKQKRDKWVNFVRTLNPHIDPQALRLMDEFNAVSRAIYHPNEQSVDAAGLSFAQYRVLMHLIFAEHWSANMPGNIWKPYVRKSEP